MRLRDKKHSSGLKYVLIILLVFGILLWLNRYTVYLIIHRFALETLYFLVTWHSYMIGLVFPEGIFFRLIWNVKANRAFNPFSKKFIPTSTMIIAGMVVTILGFYLSNFIFPQFLSSIFMDLIVLSPVFYLLWFLLSIPLTLLIFVGISSPAGAKKAIKSLSKKIGAVQL